MGDFSRDEKETCMYCQAKPFLPCLADCPCNFGDFGKALPDSLRSTITVELLKQAEFIFEKKQMDWYGNMLTERIESVMKDWPIFVNFLKILNKLNYFKNIEDVLDYLEKPSKRQQIFGIWQEMGMPITEGSRGFSLFKNAAENLKENNGRANREEE
jgi:hypothetical protein